VFDVNVIVLAGYSGSGKTTLMEKLIPALKAQGQRVSVVKHAHHRFEVDHPGKDTWRHRESGAFEVVAASPQRLVLQREFEQDVELSVHHLLAELYQGVDWVLVEGYRDCNLPKLEVWRAAHGKPAMYPNDPFVVAIATDANPHDTTAWPQPTALPVLDLNNGTAVAHWLLSQGERFAYDASRFEF
jgi:molybdopterin-guanine dinucleotide biosynthesis protein B